MDVDVSTGSATTVGQSEETAKLADEKEDAPEGAKEGNQKE